MKIVPKLITIWKTLISQDAKFLGQLRNPFLMSKEDILETLRTKKERKVVDLSLLASLEQLVNMQTCAVDFILTTQLAILDLKLKPCETTKKNSKSMIKESAIKFLEANHKLRIPPKTDLEFFTFCLKSLSLTESASLLIQEILEELENFDELLNFLPKTTVKQRFISPISEKAGQFDCSRVKKELTGLLTTHQAEKTRSELGSTMAKTLFKEETSSFDNLTRLSSCEIKASQERSRQNSRMSSNSLLFFSSSKFARKTIKHKTKNSTKLLQKKRERSSDELSSLIIDEDASQKVTSFADFLKEENGKENEGENREILLGRSPCDLKSKNNFYKHLMGTNLLNMFEQASNNKSLF